MPQKTLYLDCSSGISGDMFISALLNLTEDPLYFENKIKLLKLENYKISIEKKFKSGISCLYFSCAVNEKQPHRSYKDIKKIILSSLLEPKIQELAIDIFRNLAKAEGKIHDKDYHDAHFHEVGAVDSIIDIVGAAILVNQLDIKEVISSPIPLGSGFVTCAHGKLPVPVPAVVELLKGVPVYQTDIKDEIVTPTGAAIIKTLCKKFQRLPMMQIERVGYGAGAKEFDIPNILRAFLGRRDVIHNVQYVSVIETNIDDEKGNILGYFMTKCLQMGALDVYFTSIFMKKNRPAYKLSIICEQDKVEEFSKLILKETSSFGVRISEMKRITLKREAQKVKMPDGVDIRVKIGYDEDNILKIEPEYDDCLLYALENNKALKEVIQLVKDLFNDKKTHRRASY